MKLQSTNNSIPLDMRLIDAVMIINESHNRCVIVESKKKVIGVISEGDIMRALLKGVDVYSPVEDWISHDFKFLTNFDYDEALKLMREHGITFIPVVDENLGLQGAITLSDILQKIEISKGKQ